MEKQARVPELVQGGGLKILCVQSLVGSNPTSSIFCYFQKRGNWMEEAREREGLCVGKESDVLWMFDGGRMGEFVVSCDFLNGVGKMNTK